MVLILMVCFPSGAASRGKEKEEENSTEVQRHPFSVSNFTCWKALTSCQDHMCSVLELTPS